MEKPHQKDERYHLYTLLNVGRSALRMEEEDYRALLARHGAQARDGKVSATTMDVPGLTAALEELRALQARLEDFDRRICRAARRDERCVRLREVPGVGPLTATALVATVGNAREFKSGRELSAYLGLTPRQHSSGGKTVLLGISKHGNRYLRTLLIHGARSLMRRKNPIPHPRAQWAARLAAARGTNLATVALANHNARVLWALLSRGEAYRAGTPKGSFPPRPSNRVVERVRGGKLLVVNRT